MRIFELINLLPIFQKPGGKEVLNLKEGGGPKPLPDLSFLHISYMIPATNNCPYVGQPQQIQRYTN
jgi:hypothetical protein